MYLCSGGGRTRNERKSSKLMPPREGKGREGKEIYRRNLGLNRGKEGEENGEDESPPFPNPAVGDFFLSPFPPLPLHKAAVSSSSFLFRWLLTASSSSSSSFQWPFRAIEWDSSRGKGFDKVAKTPTSYKVHFLARGRYLML